MIMKKVKDKCGDYNEKLKTLEHIINRIIVYKNYQGHGRIMPCSCPFSYRVQVSKDGSLASIQYISY